MAYLEIGLKNGFVVEDGAVFPAKIETASSHTNAECKRPKRTTTFFFDPNNTCLRSIDEAWNDFTCPNFFGYRHIRVS
jgi:hypothetical protein